MLLFIKCFAIFFSATFIIVGFLMLVVPEKYPKLYSGLLSGSVMQRKTTERGKRLAIRTQGFGYLAIGTLIAYAFFICAIL
jgi:uncharacterized protein YjeT (DUF2065 family)